MSKPLIDPSHRGRFTRKAKAAGMSTQSYADKVMANKPGYTKSTVEQANFAKNFGKK